MVMSLPLEQSWFRMTAVQVLNNPIGDYLVIVKESIIALLESYLGSAQVTLDLCRS